KERLIISWAENTPSLHLTWRDCRCSWRPLGYCFAKRRCTVAVSAPYLLKEHPGGKSIKRKLSPKGGEPPQGYGGNLQRSRATSHGACAVCHGRQLAKR